MYISAVLSNNSPVIYLFWIFDLHMEEWPSELELRPCSGYKKMFSIQSVLKFTCYYFFFIVDIELTGNGNFLKYTLNDDFACQKSC